MVTKSGLVTMLYQTEKTNCSGLVKVCALVTSKGGDINGEESVQKHAIGIVKMTKSALPICMDCTILAMSGRVLAKLTVNSWQEVVMVTKVGPVTLACLQDLKKNSSFLKVFVRVQGQSMPTDGQV